MFLFDNGGPLKIDNGDSWSDICSTPTIVPPVSSNPYKHDFQKYQNTKFVWESNETEF